MRKTDAGGVLAHDHSKSDLRNLEKLSTSPHHHSSDDRTLSSLRHTILALVTGFSDLIIKWSYYCLSN